MAIAWPWGKSKRIRDALAAYPPFDLPNPGKGARLTSQQRESNLAWFLAAREGRKALLRETLARLDHALPEQMPNSEAVEAASLVFHRLCQDHLVGWKLAATGLDSRKELDPAARGLDGFGRDIAILLGDAAISLRPALAWVLGKEKNMPVFGEVVVGVSPSAAHEIQPFEVDVLAGAVFQLQQVADNGHIFNRPNSFSFAVDLALGRYELPLGQA